jgi:hypothetical protein
MGPAFGRPDDRLSDEAIHAAMSGEMACARNGEIARIRVPKSARINALLTIHRAKIAE